MPPYVMDDDLRAREIASLQQRLLRWGRHASPAQVARAHDETFASLNARMRVRRASGLGRGSWKVEKRTFGIWREQTPVGDVFRDQEDAVRFRDLCIRVDTRDQAHERLMAETARLPPSRRLTFLPR